MIGWFLGIGCMTALCHVLFFRTKGAVRIAVKGIGSGVCAVAALAAALAQGLTGVQLLLGIGLVFCCLGDVVLEIKFVPGMAAFAAGHVLLITWLITMCGGMQLPMLIVWLAGYALLLLLLRKKISEMKEMRLPVLAYALFLTAMTVCAVSVPLRCGVSPATVGTALAGIFFLVSDVMVGLSLVTPHTDAQAKLMMVLYYGAIWLFCFAGTMAMIAG